MSVVPNSDWVPGVETRGTNVEPPEHGGRGGSLRSTPATQATRAFVEAVGQLASGIAHVFNNIMMGILGNTSLMISKLDADHPHFDKLANIEKYVGNGSELTQQLLGFARGGKYNVKPTSLRELVEESAQMFGRTKKEIRIHIKTLPQPLVVEVDRRQIEQVLLNLLLNACKAMPEGGRLTVMCGGDEEAFRRAEPLLQPLDLTHFSSPSVVAVRAPPIQPLRRKYSNIVAATATISPQRAR